MSKFDAIVIGAGPGGSTAAYLLAGAGLRIALIEKASFPRDKLCGGLLSERTEKVYKSIFGGGWQDAYEFTSADAGFYFKNQLLNEVSGYRKMYLTKRLYLDHHLARLACHKGATLLENTCAASLEPEKGLVRLKNGLTIHGDFIIGADGPNSMAARALGLSISNKDKAAALEIEYPRQGALAELARPEIYFGVIRWGYGWILPKRDTLTIGIAGLAHKNRSIRDCFRLFLEQVCAAVPDIPWKGHAIPFRSFSMSPGRGNILLVGDAAGFAEPVTGEGIAFAMQSAHCAAQAILDAAKNGNSQSALKRYEHNHARHTRFLAQARCMRYLAFSALTEKLFAKALQRSQSAIHRYMDLAADEINYADYSKYLIKKLTHRFFR